MKILVVSNAGFVGSGYGVQTQLFTKMMLQDGYEPIVFGIHGHHGKAAQFDGVKTLPASLTRHGGDMIQQHMKAHKPEATILLYDLWVYESDQLEGVTGWIPVDHVPVPRIVGDKLDDLREVWTYTMHSHEMLKFNGVKNYYVPLAVDCEAFSPMDRNKARDSIGFDQDSFVAVMVGANKTYPGRKSFDRVFKAWARFIERHPQSVLYVHTMPASVHGGYDLQAMAHFYGISHTVRFSSIYGQVNNQYTTEHLRWLYSAADVMVMPSRTEGFGVPAVEAQACGCPVIVSDWGPQRELGQMGYPVKIFDDDLFYTQYDSEVCNPRPSEIWLALEHAFDHKNDPKMRSMALDFAQNYDYRLIWSKYMKPRIEAQIAQNREREKRTEQRISMRKVKANAGV